MDNKEKFKGLFLQSIEKIKEENVAIAFSGGIDSALIAQVMKKRHNVMLYVTGIEGSYDIDAAKTAAKKLDLPLSVITITEDDIEEAMKDIISILSSLDIKEDTEIPPRDPRNIITISFNLPFYFVAKNCKEKVLISGQGPDTYLGGYTKHLSLDEEKLKKELEKNTYDLIYAGSKQHEEIGKYFGKDVHLPYIDEELLRFSLELPIEWKIKDGKRKIILVEVSKDLGLPEDIAERTKKSAQYGSGIMKSLKKIAKRKGISVSELVNQV